MAEREVTIEKTVEETETLTICNQCGREVDDDGIYAHGIHLCSECHARLKDIDGDRDDEYVERVEEWLEETDGWEDTVRKNLYITFTSLFIIAACGWVAVLVNHDFVLFVITLIAALVLVPLCLYGISFLTQLPSGDE